MPVRRFGDLLLRFGVARRLLRPLLMRLTNVRGTRLRERSFLAVLTTTFAGLLFVSLGLAIFDEKRESVEYASAGHMPPYVMTNGELREVPVSSLPLGLFTEANYRNQHISFPPGSRLVLYTDGIVEGRGENGERLGFDEFERDLTASFVAGGIISQLDILMDGFGRSDAPRYADDRTAVLIERIR